MKALLYSKVIRLHNDASGDLLMVFDRIRKVAIVGGTHGNEQ
jgi:succinylglutamate desuccinylase